MCVVCVVKMCCKDILLVKCFYFWAKKITGHVVCMAGWNVVSMVKTNVTANEFQLRSRPGTRVYVHTRRYGHI